MKAYNVTFTLGEEMDKRTFSQAAFCQHNNRGKE